MARDNQPQKKGDYLTVTDPARFQMAKSMTPLPGSPAGVENNPNNVVGFFGMQPNTYEFSYGDMALNDDPRMAQVMPMPNSGMPQQMVPGTKQNMQTPMIQQPPPSAADEFESMRLGGEAASLGLMPSPMGMIGQGITPGGVLPTPQQAPNTMPLTTIPPEEAAQMNGQPSKMKRGSRSSKGMRT